MQRCANDWCGEQALTGPRLTTTSFDTAFHFNHDNADWVVGELNDPLKSLRVSEAQQIA
jgi:hypothetical protein